MNRTLAILILSLPWIVKTADGSVIKIDEFVKARIQSDLGFREQTSQSGSNFYRGQWQGVDSEMVIRATRLGEASSEVVKKRTQVESLNIQNLYRQRRNPYEGQITETIQCSSQYGPFVSKLTVHGHSAILTCGGVDVRHRFGACVKNQMRHWGCHFTFQESDVALDVRLFSKKPDAAELTKLQVTARKLFVL